MRLEGQPVFLRECARETLRLQRAHLDQHVGEFLPGLLALARLVEILRGNPRSIEQNCLETFARSRHQASLRMDSADDAKRR